MDHQMAGMVGGNDEETKVIYESGMDGGLQVSNADAGIGEDYQCGRCR